jgi:sarcosine oxidase subunit gamma
MSSLTLKSPEPRELLGLKGPRAAQWLAAQGIDVPGTPNTWTHSAEAAAESLLVARLGAAEFFLEEAVAGSTFRQIAASLQEHPSGVYPVLREDSAFLLGGEGVHDVLAQVCNVNFAALHLDSRPLIMTLMIGLAVLVVPQRLAGERGAAGNAAGERGAAEQHPGAAGQHPGAEARQYRIWCDPTFGPYLGQSLGGVVVECGGEYTGV